MCGERRWVMPQGGEIDVAESAVRAEGVTKVYPGRRRQERRVAVADLDLDVRPGTVLGLLGPNGAGKSTTIGMLAGLVSPTRGRIRICGRCMRRARQEAVARVAVVLDRARALYPRLTPVQNIRYFASARGCPKGAVKRGRQWLSRFGAAQYADAPVYRLSLGTQQKAVLACALAMEPDVLLLDEPTVGLDVPSSLELRSAMRMLAEEEGKCVILSTHQMDVAQSVCHDVCVLAQGRVMAYGSVKRLLTMFAAMAYRIAVRGAVSAELRRALSSVATVRCCSAYASAAGHHASMQLEVDSERAFYEVIGILHGAGLEIESVTREEPCLERAYLKLVAGGDDDGIVGRVGDRSGVAEKGNRSA